MLTDMEFVKMCIDLAELEEKRLAMVEQMEEYVKRNGSIKVGAVDCKVTTPRKKYDYQETWDRHGASTEIDIEDYLVQPPQPPQPPAYYDYMAAVKAGKIKKDDYAISNLSDLDKKKVSIKVTL